MLSRILKLLSLEPTLRRRSKWARRSCCSLGINPHVRHYRASGAGLAMNSRLPFRSAKPSPITALGGEIQRLQGFITREDEVFPHLHLHIRPREQMTQALAIAKEFRLHRREEQLDAGHSSGIV